MPTMFGWPPLKFFLDPPMHVTYACWWLLLMLAATDVTLAQLPMHAINRGLSN